MGINTDFECSNIIVEAETDVDVSLLIRPDTNADYYQWFYFKDVQPPKVITRTYRIFNASGASYQRAWVGYDVLASYDEKTWFRIPTRYDGSHLIWQHQATTDDTISFAFFIPYFSEQREKLLTEVVQSSHVQRRVLGKSLEGVDMDMLIFGDESRSDAKTIWLVSRQHAGEPMAEYATEGFIRRLLDVNDETAQDLLSQATIYVVPNMNPDGSAAGNLRANFAGVDLNRVWHDCPDNAPEVQCVLDAIKNTGCDFFIDMHGDEIRPFIWIVGPDYKLTLDQTDRQNQFTDFLSAKHPEMLPPPAEILSGTLPAPGISVNFMNREYGCPGWIIELPFRETPVGDTLHVKGCMQFGRNCVAALLNML